MLRLTVPNQRKEEGYDGGHDAPRWLTLYPSSPLPLQTKSAEGTSTLSEAETETEAEVKREVDPQMSKSEQSRSRFSCAGRCSRSDGVSVRPASSCRDESLRSDARAATCVVAKARNAARASVVDVREIFMIG